MLKIVLASASPRRKKLLQQIGLVFEIHPSKLTEEHSEETDPALFAEDIARQKSEEVASRIPNALIIGADTIVTLDGTILGKPADQQDAVKMLESLSGRKHSVFTGVCISVTDENCNITHSSEFSEETKVWFSELEISEIARYVESGSPMDKAGSYGIQEDMGSLFVKRIEGDFFNVVGFPINRFYNELKQLNPSLVEV